jgi:hypothetical protein
MVSLADVKRWDPGVLNEVARILQQREQILIHSGDDFGKVMPVEGWSGPASELSTGDATGIDEQHHITHEHGQYLDNNSTSQYNMASVVAGRPDLTVRHVQPWEVPSPPPTPGQPIPAPPGRDPQPPPLPPR